MKMVDGSIGKDERIRLMATGKESEVLELGYFSPGMTPVDGLFCGEVGYIATGLKVVKDLQVGDTITGATNPASEAGSGLSPGQADGVRGTLSRRRRGISRCCGMPSTA